MEWITIAYVALAISIVSQLVIWWFDRKNPTKLRWLRRIIAGLPMRASEKTFLEHYERQRRDFARYGLCGKVIVGSVPGPLDTRVGGPLIVPKGTEVPTNALGVPLLPLVLIRLSDLPAADGNVLPRAGWIQVLVDASDFWKVPLPVAQGASFRLVHHAEATEFDVHPVDAELGREHPAWTGGGQDPALFQTGLSIGFKPVLDIAPADYYKLDGFSASMVTKAYDDAMDAYRDALDSEVANCDVMIGGHAHFTQGDIRDYPIHAGLENLIRMSGSGRVFSWSDAGEASIMVPEGDLDSGRLDRAVLYYDYH